MCSLLEKRIIRYPKGKIHIKKKSNSIQYYLRTNQKDKSGKYISVSDTKKIQLFLQKKYDEQIYPLIFKEKENISKYLLKAISKEDIQNIYSAYPEVIKQHINPVDISDEEYIKKWLNNPYERKPIYENVPLYITDNGEQVRSKSELNIANALKRQGCPYKYECPIQLNDKTILYPDFTILIAEQRKEIYWEHRGMMDDRDYVKHTVKRIKLYNQNDIFLGDRLIITEEASMIQLGTEEINRIIKNYIKQK